MIYNELHAIHNPALSEISANLVLAKPILEFENTTGISLTSDQNRQT